MKTIGFVACGLVLLGTPAAHAQTSVTREITNEPVETIVTRGPNGTVVTRRPLNAAPEFETAAPSVQYLHLPRRPVAVEETTETEPPSTVGLAARPVRTTRSTTEVTTRTQTRRQAVRDSARRQQAAAPVRRQAAPTREQLALSPAQRQTVYRTIVQREIYPAPVRPTVQPVYPPAYAQEVIEPPVRNYPLRAIYPFTNDNAYGGRYTYQPYDQRYAATGYDYARYPARTYVVGSRLPESVPLVAVPESVAIQVPATRPYHYAVINNRVYLVDPVTSLIVADVTQ
jgi:hypothetical protein